MTDTSKRLGYGGSALITGVSSAGNAQVLITGGTMEQAITPSYLEMANIPPSITPVTQSRVLHASGVVSYSGTLSFDMTTNALSFFTVNKLLMRRFQFHIGIDDGTNHWTMRNCYLTNLTISGAPAGFITSSLSYMSREVKNNIDPVTNNYILSSDIPMGYWWSGNTDVKEWTLTMNQVVEPVYTNEDASYPDPSSPRYLKVGLVDYTLDVTCYSPQVHNIINIATTSFTLNGVSTASGYHFNGTNNLGMYTHSFTTAATFTGGGSGGLVIS